MILGYYGIVWVNMGCGWIFYADMDFYGILGYYVMGQDIMGC